MNRIVGRLVSLEEVRVARTVCCYVALSDEVPTRSLIEWCWHDSKSVVVPKITDHQLLTMVELTTWDELQPSTFHILEPRSNARWQRSPDVIIVPGQLFDETGNRKGRGYGYYDQFLAQYPLVPKVGLTFEHSVIPQLLSLPHDVPMTYVVTEKRTLGPFRRGDGG